MAADLDLLSTYDRLGERPFYAGFSDLNRLATYVVRRDYLETLTTLPRFQDIPRDAFLTHCNSPIFVSHHWRNRDEPDDAILHQLRSFVPNTPGVGVWIDYCCVPQRRRNGVEDRTELEKRFFVSQLQYIPTILLKSQLVVLWNEAHARRAWCLIELLISDILRNVIMKQVYHCKGALLDPVVLGVQTYAPPSFNITTGVEGAPVPKMLVPHSVKDMPTHFYNSMLAQLGMPPSPVTKVLERVRPEHIDAWFTAQRLACSNEADIAVLKALLAHLCQFAGAYDVTTIKWNGKIPFGSLWPYLAANLSDFTTTLVGYKF